MSLQHRLRLFAGRMLPRFAIATVVLLYLVVVAGSVVKATGSGMGCPDWPFCYGRIIPPTRAEEIDFSRLNIERFQDAWQRAGHPRIEVTEETLKRDFNAASTWTEFINRCIGMLSGLAALGTLVCALMSRLHDRKLIGVLVVQLALFGVVAWLGKVVVDTNLLPWKITLHMLLAVMLVSTSLVALHFIRAGNPAVMTRSLRWHLVVAGALVIAQIMIGSQVREMADHLAPGDCCDGRVEERLGVPFLWHRAGAILALTAVATAFFRLRFTTTAGDSAPLLVPALGLLVCLEYGAGVILVKAGMPAFLKPVHLVIAVMLHGMLLALWLRSRLQSPTVAATMNEHE